MRHIAAGFGGNMFFVQNKQKSVEKFFDILRKKIVKNIAILKEIW